MKRRRARRQKRVRPRQKLGMFYNARLIVNKGINPRSWDNYLQRGSGGQKCGILAQSKNLHRFANWINKQERKPRSYDRQKGRKWGRRLAPLFF